MNLKEKGYKEGEYVSSFAGFIPAHKPKFIIYLVIDGAKDNFYASSLVAPLFSKVASYAVRQADLLPTVLKEESVLLASKGDSGSFQTESEVKTETFSSRSLAGVENKEGFVLIPNLKGLSLRQALKELENQELEIKIKGSGRLLKSVPQSGEILHRDKPLVLIFG